MKTTLPALLLLSSAVAFGCGGGAPESASPPRASHELGQPVVQSTLDAGLTLRAMDASAPESNAARPRAPRTVLVVSVDGLRHDYLDDAARAPNLRRLRDEGARARSLRSVWPTMTYPAHTTLVTGARPARHGIVNNIVFDPFNKNDHGWYWYASDIRVPTLWDVATKQGMSVGNVYWPVTVGADISYSIPQMWRAKTDEDDKLLRALSTKNLLRSGKAPPAEHRGDRERTDAALEIIREKHPRLMFVYLTDLDTVQHERGPMSAEALRTLRMIDGYVGELLVATGGESTALALVSDHGFSAVNKEIRPNALMKSKGWLTTAGPKLVSYKLITWKAGGTAAIIPSDPKDTATARAAQELFTRLAKDPSSGIARVLSSDQTSGTFAEKNAAFVLEARPGYVFSESWAEPLVSKATYKGAHGYAPELPDMGATLFFWGDGVKPGELGDVEMIDVAPTIASLLGLTLPKADGKPLAGALLPQ